MTDRLLTTKRVRAIIKTAMDRHGLTIKSSKTRQTKSIPGFLFLNPLMTQYSTNLREIKYLIKYDDYNSLINAIDEIDTILILHGTKKTNANILSKNLMRLEIHALIK